MRRLRVMYLALGCLMAFTGACGGSSGHRAGNSDAKSKSGAAAGGSTRTAGAVASPAAVPKGQPADGAPSIVYRGRLDVRVKDRRGASAQAVKVAEQAGGRLSDQTADLEGDGDATLTFKVPPARFRPVLERLSELGRPLSRKVSSQDVTDQVVDLRGRLATARASAARLRGLLERAPDVPGIVAVETELAKREAEVESLSGQARVLANRVDLATIELTLTVRGDPTVDKDIPGFLRGIRTGWVAFVNFLALIVTAVGLVAPFLLIAAPALLLLRWWRRNHPRRRLQPAFATAPGAGGPTVPWPPVPASAPPPPTPRPAGAPEPPAPRPEGDAGQDPA